MRHLKNLLFVVCTMLFLAVPAIAQAPTGSIEGTVTDPSDAVVATAKVTITEIATRRVINLTTTTAGLFAARALQPGKYKVQVSASGFRDYVIPEVTVEAGGAVVVSPKLELGPTTQVVEVTSSPVLLNTSTPTVAGVVTAQQIDEMPLNARNFLELAALEPGVQIGDGGSIDPTKSKTYRTVQIEGRSGTGTRVQIDGIDITDETVGTTLCNISDDAVQEFELSQSSLDLSTSLTSSGAVSIISRSGTNDFHGSGFWYYRNQDMGARLNFLTTNEPFHRTQVGYRFGGPIKKNSLFFFSNWERTYQQEQGIYTSDANFPNVPFGSNNNCTSGCPAGIPLGIRMVDNRLDWNIKSTVRTFARFTHYWDLATGGDIPNSPFQNKDQTIMLVGGVDATTPRLSHSIRFGSVYFHNQIVSQSFSSFPFPKTPNGIEYFLGVGAYAIGPNGLAPQGTLQQNYQGKYDGSFLFGRHTLHFGFELNHIQLGGFANFSGPMSVAGDFTAANQAAIKAGGGNAQDPLQYPLTDFSMGPDLGFFTIDPCFGYAHGCHRNTRTAWYFGDSFKARRNLTLILGTRWEYDSGYFNDESKIKRPAFLDYWGKGIATAPHYPYDAFGPQFGFAWDPKGEGKTSVRGGVYVAYEMNIFNNLLFDQFALIPPGIGPDSFGPSFVGTPNGSPITPQVAGVTSLPASCQTASAQTALAGGDWSCLLDNSIGSVIGIVGQVTSAMKASYTNFQFNPQGVSQFQSNRGNVIGYLVGGSQFKIPYATQMNFGIQHEVKPGHVFTADFLYNHGVGMPFLGEDLECRRCAKTLNVAKAQAKVNSVLGGLTVDQWIAANPGKTISRFGLANDTIFQGLTPDPNSPYPETQTTNFIRARVMTRGGFTKYWGLQMKMTGRMGSHGRLLRDMAYHAAWAIGRSDATNGSFRPEFLNNAQNKLNPRDARYFGPVPEDRLHLVSGAIFWNTLGGVRLSQRWTFQSTPRDSLFIPALGGISGPNAIFTTDATGSGSIGGGGPVVGLIPGLNWGQWGRGVNSFAQLNQILTNYNSAVAGTLTPAGQALVNAGIFTKDQLVKLKAVFPTIPLVPTSNPWPFQRLVNADVGVTRPTKIGERIEVIPWFQVFNLFNETGLTNNKYGGLGTTFGSLNFAYATPGDVATLASQRGRNHDTRLMQIGVRVTF